MNELAKAKQRLFSARKLPKTEAVKYFTEKGDEYKLDLLRDLKDGEITFYTQGNFTDLCRGPHIPNTGFIKAIKLTNIAGAYWKGDERNKQLTRIYGVTFPSQKELDEYLHLLEEAKKSDHRKLGKELGIFTFDDDVGPGLPLWMPNGTIIIEELEKLAKETEAGGRLQAGGHAAYCQGKHVHHQRPPAVLSGQHVSAHGAGRSEILPEGHELPASPQDFCGGAEEL